LEYEGLIFCFTRVAMMEMNVFALESGNFEADDSEIKQRYDNQRQVISNSFCKCILK